MSGKKKKKKKFRPKIVARPKTTPKVKQEQKANTGRSNDVGNRPRNTVSEQSNKVKTKHLVPNSPKVNEVKTERKIKKEKVEVSVDRTQENTPVHPDKTQNEHSLDSDATSAQHSTNEYKDIGPEFADEDDIEYSTTTSLPNDIEMPIFLSPELTSETNTSIGEWVCNADNEGCFFSIQLPSELPFDLPTDNVAEHVGKNRKKLPYAEMNAFADPRAVGNTLETIAQMVHEKKTGEAEFASSDHQTEEQRQDFTDSENSQLHEIRIGKLRVHESGRVTMLVGGIEFDVESAIDTSFVQNAVDISLGADEAAQERWRKAQMSPDSVKPGTHYYSSGTMNIRGEIQRRVICTPNIDSLLKNMDI